MNLTPEQTDRLKQGQAVELQEPTVGAVVVLLSEVYEAITDACSIDCASKSEEP
jgi:hypothetical protein